MTMPVLPEARVRVPPHRWVLARCAVTAGRLLARRPPKRLRAVLERVGDGARAATYEEARLARDTVLTVSTRCCGPEACLPRSLAAALLCRAAGAWPTWCAGVLPTAPFSAHAWIEAEGRPVGEPVGAGYYLTLVTVPPR